MIMSNDEPGKSDALGTRVANLKARMLEAEITIGEIHSFHKVAAILDGGHGRIDGDDLIAASFLPDPRE
jgi:hypothetical protein